MKDSLLLDIIAAQKRGEPRGITSICSTNPFVLDAAFAHAQANGRHLLIESTCNQVNQYGGYTGQTPYEFMKALRQMAEKHRFPLSRLITGGDHLGPNPWRHETAEKAMKKSHVLVHDYVRAGYSKIHLDTSMKCADDAALLTDAALLSDTASFSAAGAPMPLPTEVIAARSAELARVAEDTYWSGNGSTSPPLYIIGTEVPAPGGVNDSEEGPPELSKPAAVEETILATQAAFKQQGLESAWERVIAVVVQPGVEFGNDVLFDYDAGAAAPLSHFIHNLDSLVFEAHSTDYQTKKALKELVRDQFAILKVGPALTFAFRQAIFALAEIEEAWLNGRAGVILSNIRQVVDDAMLENPVYWKSYYPGDDVQQRYARKYSLSDRIRYYWPVKTVSQSIDCLLTNLSATPIPLPLLSQYMPDQFRAVRNGQLLNQPRQLIEHAVTAVLDDYAYACGAILPLNNPYML